MKTKIIVSVSFILLVVLCFTIVITKNHSAPEERAISYIQDERTNLCYAVYNDAVVCVQCTEEVTYEAYFNYKGVYIPKH